MKDNKVDLFLSEHEYNTVETIGRLLKFSHNGKFGILDIDELFYTEPIYDDILLSGSSFGRIIVKRNSLFGLISCDGKGIIPCVYDKVEQHPNGLICFYTIKKNKNCSDVIILEDCINIKGEHIKLGSNVRPLTNDFSYNNGNIIDGNGETFLSLPSYDYTSWTCYSKHGIVFFDTFYFGYGFINSKKKIWLVKKSRFADRKNPIKLNNEIVQYEKDIEDLRFFAEIDNNKYLKIKEGGKWNIIDENFNYQLNNNYLEIDDYGDPGFLRDSYKSADNDGLTLTRVKSENGYGWMDSKFKEVVPSDYPWIYPFLKGWCIMTNENDVILSIRSLKGKEIPLYPEYDDAGDTFNNGLLLVRHITRGYGFLDEKGKEVIRCKYCYAEDFRKDRVKVRYDTEFGYINRKGELYVKKGENESVIPSRYCWGWDYKDGYAIVQQGKLYGIINEDGEEIIPCLYDRIEIIESNRFIVEIEFSGKELYPNRQDKVLRHSDKGELQFDYIYINEEKYNKQLLVDDTDHFLLSLQGREIRILQKYDWIFPYVEGCARVVKNGRWGFIDDCGNEIVLFESGVMVYDFSCCLALINDEINKSFFYINKRGEIVISFDKLFHEEIEEKQIATNKSDGECKNIQVEEAYPFKGGIARLKSGGKYGFINTNKEIVIPFSYDYADDYNEEEDLIEVAEIASDRNIYKYINKKGCSVTKKDKFQEIKNLGITYQSIYESFQPFWFGRYKLCRDYSKFKQPSKSTNISRMKYVLCDSWRNVLIHIYMIHGRCVYAEVQKPNSELLKIKELDIKFFGVVNGYFIMKRQESYDNEKILGRTGNSGITYREPLYCITPVKNDLKWCPKHEVSTPELNRIEDTIDFEIKNKNTIRILIDENHKYGYSDLNGKMIIPCQYEEALAFRGGFAAIKKSERWGAINQNGEIVVPCIYDEPLFFINGISIIKHDDKYGFVRNDNFIISPCIYDEVRNFKEGMAAVAVLANEWSIEKKWGFINERGELIIENKYSKARDFSDGLAYVKEERGQLFINKKGEVVIKLDFLYGEVSDFRKRSASAIYNHCRPGREDDSVLITKENIYLSYNGWGEYHMVSKSEWLKAFQPDED